MTPADGPLRWMAEHAGADGSTDVLALGKPSAGGRLAVWLLPSTAVALLAAALANLFQGLAVAIAVGVLAFLFCLGVQVLVAAPAAAPADTEPEEEPGEESGDDGTEADGPDADGPDADGPDADGPDADGLDPDGAPRDPDGGPDTEEAGVDRVGAEEAGETRVTWSIREAGAHWMALAAVGVIAFQGWALITLIIEWTNSTYVSTGAYTLCQTVSATDAARAAARAGLSGMLAALGLILPFAGLRQVDRPQATEPRSPLVSAIRPGGGVVWVASLAVPIVIVEYFVGTTLAGLRSADSVPMFHSLPQLHIIPRIGIAWRYAIAGAPGGRLFPSLLWCVLVVVTGAFIAYAVSTVAELQVQAYRWLALRSFARQAGITVRPERFLADAVDAGLVTHDGDRYTVVHRAGSE